MLLQIPGVLAAQELAHCQQLTLRLNVNNFTDEVYAISLNNNGGLYNPGPERSYLLSADFSF